MAKKVTTRFGFVVMTAILSACAVRATEPMRIWVDESGRFSIEARLVEVNEESIVLLRKTGGTVALDRNKVSELDQNYIDEIEQSLMSAPNQLRLQPPVLPAIRPLPVLDLPSCDYTAEEDSILVLDRSSVMPRLELPFAVPPDAAPFHVAFEARRYALERIGTHDVASRVIPVRIQSASGVAGDDVSLALSISGGRSLPGQPAGGKIIRFDADHSEPVTMWESNEPIRLFDHHRTSGRSLVLVGHSPVGHGGQLAIARGWQRASDSPGNSLVVSNRRTLPPPLGQGRLQTVRWARWIDEEHACVLLDQTLVVWNLVSGEQVFRVNGVNEKSQPALSAGKRYVAVPGMGTVDLYRTIDGKPIGRIPVESSRLPVVAFAPRGDALAIVTSQRLRVWDLPSAAIRADVQSRRSLGNDPPLWVSDDLVMSGSGVLSSLFRGVPVWQYDVTGSMTSSVGPRVAVLRKNPTTELSVVSIPHESALDAIKWIDNSPRPADADQWRLPGRSVWTDGRWTDRDVRLSSLGVEYR